MVDSATWLRHLPWSVEAIYYIACEEGQANTQYSGADGRGPAGSCGQARANAVAAHRAYLTAYRLTSKQFPILELRTDVWDEPFEARPEENADVFV